MATRLFVYAVKKIRNQNRWPFCVCPSSHSLFRLSVRPSVRPILTLTLNFISGGQMRLPIGPQGALPFPPGRGFPGAPMDMDNMATWRENFISKYQDSTNRDVSTQR